MIYDSCFMFLQKIPNFFTQLQNVTLNDEVLLRVNADYSWKTKFSKDNYTLSSAENFLNTVNWERLCPLIFNYVGEDMFDVMVFNTCGYEINYAEVCKNNVNLVENVSASGGKN